MNAPASAPALAADAVDHARPLAGQTALVTGATAGIGQGVAFGLAAAGGMSLYPGFRDNG